MKIAIVGSKPDTWNKVPLLDKGWEIWRFSRMNFNRPPHYHRWFELHDPKHYRRYELSFPGYSKFLATDPRVVLQHHFPKDRLLEEFGPFFFSGGQAPWLLAYAISLNPDTIGLWGIEPGPQYKNQLSEIWHFVQIARDRGIEVIAPEDKVLKNSPLYAFETDTLTGILDKLGIPKERQAELYADPPKPLVSPDEKRAAPEPRVKRLLYVTPTPRAI